MDEAGENPGGRPGAAEHGMQGHARSLACHACLVTGRRAAWMMTAEVFRAVVVARIFGVILVETPYGILLGFDGMDGDQ
jgi:hypothetical protein